MSESKKKRFAHFFIIIKKEEIVLTGYLYVMNIY